MLYQNFWRSNDDLIFRNRITSIVALHIQGALTAGPKKRILFWKFSLFSFELIHPLMPPLCVASALHYLGVIGTFSRRVQHLLSERQPNFNWLPVSTSALYSAASCENRSSHTLGAVSICEGKQTKCSVGWLAWMKCCRRAQCQHVAQCALWQWSGGDVKQEQRQVWIPSVLKILFYFQNTVQDGKGGTFWASLVQILALWIEGLVKHGSWKLSGLVKCFVTSLDFHTATPGSSKSPPPPPSNSAQCQNGLNLVGTMEASVVQVAQPLNAAAGCRMTHPWPALTVLEGCQAAVCPN